MTYSNLWDEQRAGSGCYAAPACSSSAAALGQIPTLARLREWLKNLGKPKPAATQWQEGDKASPMQLAQWMHALKVAGLPASEIAYLLTQWRKGTLAFGVVPGTATRVQGGVEPVDQGGGVEWEETITKHGPRLALVGLLALVLLKGRRSS